MSVVVTCSIGCSRYVDCDVVITAEADVGAFRGNLRDARDAAQTEVERRAAEAGWEFDPGAPNRCPKCAAAEMEFKEQVINAVAALLDSKGLVDDAAYVREWGWIDFDDDTNTREKRIGAVLRAVKHLKQDEIRDVLLALGRQQEARP